MDKIFNITSSFKSKTEEKGVSIIGLASATATDRAGDVIPAEAWMKGGLHDFKKNPIILFNHNYDLPIGKAVNIEPGDEGLQMEAFISNSAPNGISELIKDGVLGAFSVGFRIKDADYIEETGGLLIKDAELFEVSVVSVPCNQDATFSIAKSFDSDDEYEEFKKTFTNRVDLAGQKLAKEEANASNIASDAPDGANAHMENKMTEDELQAFAKKVAEETAAKMAMKQAEKDAATVKAAAEKAEADAAALIAKEAEAEKNKTIITTGIESGTEALMKDVEAKLSAKDANLAEVIAGFAKDLEEKNDEITKMRESKRVFSDNGAPSDKNITSFGKEFMYAHMLGVMTDKGYNTKYAGALAEKAGIEWDGVTDAPDIAQEISSRIEKEIMVNLRTASLFREITVNGQSTVLPIQPDVNPATWQTGAAVGGNLDNRGDADNTFKPQQVVLQAFRLISQTYMDNHIDEEVLINLMPMLIDSVSRSHARAVDIAVLGNGGAAGFNGIKEYATPSTGGSLDLDGATIAAGNSATLTALMLMNARKQMGKYGLDPEDIAYVVSQARYYDLIADPEFSDMTEIGTLANKLTGTVGGVYGTPVIVTDNFEAEAAGTDIAYAVNLRNYVIPRLRGVRVEQDNEVGNQRRVIVATQSLGFNELVPDDAFNQSAVAVQTVA